MLSKLQNVHFSTAQKCLNSTGIAVFLTLPEKNSSFFRKSAYQTLRLARALKVSKRNSVFDDYARHDRNKKFFVFPFSRFQLLVVFKWDSFVVVRQCLFLNI